VGASSPWEGAGWDRGRTEVGAAPVKVFLAAVAPLLSSPLLQPTPSQGGGTLRPKLGKAKAGAYASEGPARDLMHT
jgi:hypothetical protein